MAILLAITLAAFVAARCAHAAAQTRSTSAARAWRAPHGWLRQAFCVHRHESVDWHRAGVDWQGNPSNYYGGMQMVVSTWRSVGGRGLPSDWPPREQLYRAFLVWRRDGDSWAEWPVSGAECA